MAWQNPGSHKHIVRKTLRTTWTIGRPGSCISTAKGSNNIFKIVYDLYDVLRKFI